MSTVLDVISGYVLELCHSGKVSILIVILFELWVPYNIHPVGPWIHKVTSAPNIEVHLTGLETNTRPLAKCWLKPGRAG